MLLPNGRDMFVVSEPDELIRYTCPASEVTTATVQEESFHAMLQSMYNTTLGGATGLYHGLLSQEMLEKVEKYLGNTTLNSLMAEVNSTIYGYVPESLQNEAGVAAVDIALLLVGLFVIYIVVVCAVRCVFGGFRRCRRLLCCCCQGGGWRGGKEAGGHAYGHMEAYDDVELGLELGELEGFLDDDDGETKDEKKH